MFSSRSFASWRNGLNINCPDTPCTSTPENVHRTEEKKINNKTKKENHYWIYSTYLFCKYFDLDVDEFAQYYKT